MTKPWPPPGRIPCVVIGCRRTAPAERCEPDTIIICGKCSRLAKPERREYRKWRRMIAKADARGLTTPRIRAKANAAWDRLIERVTQIKVGISA